MSLDVTLTLNAEFARGGDVLRGNHEGVGSGVFPGDVLQQQLVDLFVDDDVDAVRGRDGSAVLHPGSLHVLLREADLQLGDIALAHGQVG